MRLDFEKAHWNREVGKLLFVAVGDTSCGLGGLAIQSENKRSHAVSRCVRQREHL